jgi:hypothetical protein
MAAQSDGRSALGGAALGGAPLKLLSDYLPQRRSEVGRHAPSSIVMARARGLPLARIGRDHGLTRYRLDAILRAHSLYCFGRIERAMLRQVRHA